jgi:hypothetical protein
MMTTNSTTTFTEEGAKARAYAVRERATALGYSVSMTHTYELLATASGYRNWPTMKAAIPGSVANVAGLRLGDERATDSADLFLGTRRIGIPFTSLPDHLEVIGSIHSPTADLLARLTEATLRENIGSATIAHFTRDQLSHIQTTAAKMDIDITVIDLNFKRRRSGNDLNIFREMSASELVAFLKDCTRDRFQQKPFPADALVGRTRAVRFAEGLAPIVVWLRDERAIDLDIFELRDHLNLGRLIDIACKTTEPRIPDAVVADLRTYLEGIPNFEWSRGRNQGKTTKWQHELVESEFISPLASSYISQDACSRRDICVCELVKDSGNIVISLPEASALGPSQWAFVFALTRMIHRSAVARRSPEVPFVVATDIFEKFLNIDNIERSNTPTFSPDFRDRFSELQQILSEASAANCGYILASDAQLPIPALKRAHSVHMAGSNDPYHFAKLVTAFESVDFSFEQIAETS